MPHDIQKGEKHMTSKLRRWLLFLIFLNGYVSLSLELVVLRQLGFFVGSSAVITSIIMGTFLGFMSLGYFRGASIRIRKMGAKSILRASFIIIVQSAFWPAVLHYFRHIFRLCT